MKKLALLFLLLLVPVAFSQPKIDSYVTDKGGILSPSAISNLEARLRQLEKDTNGVQFIVFIENEYPKEFSLEEYTLEIAQKNRVGKGENDNGILLYVAVKDRVYRWEVGYGAESTLNTPLLGRISREYLLPNFQKNEYEAGIVSVVDIVSRVLLNSNDPDIVSLKNNGSGKMPVRIKFYLVAFILFFAFIIITSIITQKKANAYRKKHGKWPDYYYTGAAGGMFAGGFGGPPRGGMGGFGGFSGGGGGFGGGGFSGRF